jgi:hypothetical protein
VAIEGSARVGWSNRQFTEIGRVLWAGDEYDIHYGHRSKGRSKTDDCPEVGLQAHGRK